MVPHGRKRKKKQTSRGDRIPIEVRGESKSSYNRRENEQKGTTPTLDIPTEEEEAKNWMIANLQKQMGEEKKQSDWFGEQLIYACFCRSKSYPKKRIMVKPTHYLPALLRDPFGPSSLGRLLGLAKLTWRSFEGPGRMAVGDLRAEDRRAAGE